MNRKTIGHEQKETVKILNYQYEFDDNMKLKTKYTGTQEILQTGTTQLNHKSAGLIVSTAILDKTLNLANNGSTLFHPAYQVP